MAELNSLKRSLTFQKGGKMPDNATEKLRRIKEEKRLQRMKERLRKIYAVVNPAAYGFFVVKEKNKTAGHLMLFVDARSGEPAFDRRFKIAFSFSKNGVAAVSDGRKMFYINKTGHPIFGTNFNYAGPFNDKTDAALARISQNYFSLTIENNKLVISPRERTKPSTSS